MARYNSVITQASASSSGTQTAPTQGLFTELTGSGYTFTIANPTLYAGSSQTFFNAGSGNITLSTPSGIFAGPASSGTSSFIMPANSIITLFSDGTNWNTAFAGGGPATTSTLTASSTATFNGNAQFNAAVTASSSFTPSATYDLTTLTYIQSKYGQPWSYQSSTFTATAGGRYFCNGGITVNLPSSPTIGDSVHIIDYNGNFNSSNLTVSPQGGIYIMRQNSSMTVSTPGAAFQLVYSGSTTIGWLVAQGI